MLEDYDYLGDITYEQLEAFLQSISGRQPLIPEASAGLEKLRERGPYGRPGRIRVVAVLKSDTPDLPWEFSHFGIG
jgi:hypothetical protein